MLEFLGKIGLAPLKKLGPYIEETILFSIRPAVSKFSRWLITLSTGAILLSLTFIEKLNPLNFQFFLISSWMFFTISILSGLIFESSLVEFKIRYLGGVIPNRKKEMEEREKGNTLEANKAMEKANDESKKNWNVFNKHGVLADCSQRTSFLLAVSFLIIFAIANFWQYSNFFNIIIKGFLVNIWNMFF